MLSVRRRLLGERWRLAEGTWLELWLLTELRLLDERRRWLLPPLLPIRRALLPEPRRLLREVWRRRAAPEG